MLLQIPAANWFGSLRESFCKDKAKGQNLKPAPEQDQEEAGFLSQQSNSVLKSVIIMSSTFLLQHKHGRQDDISNQGAQQQG